ncbi:carbon-monoxide dehydrogenase medium subunit [Rugosimonospora africana]|uniref:Carbon-monoxide dehydrogenase medium subunit n=1 Tax=Rugosimonospora africana TaxID=556532 RepID=A0A8J3QNP1_9ACTN|nr:carbon-monoxide dehydrogenase medium subunit [Rugosimonospora africana]
MADVGTAVGTVTADPASAFLAGGTTQVDLLRIYVEQPRRLVDINDLPLRDIEELPNRGLRIGALARMNEVAEHPSVIDRSPLVSQALLLGASPQLRNMASIGGNLLQRTRCTYFRDVSTACNKRTPGTGCAAMDGVNRGHAVLGTSDQCIATHPSDLAVALVALDADVIAEGQRGRRSIPVHEFFLPPEDTPDIEHPLDHGELIVDVEVPPAPDGSTSLYLKVRDRESYEFALASVAVALRVEGGMVVEVRLALGGVATVPWRARRAERMLTGQPATTENFAAAAREELAPAVARGMNGFKIELACRTIVRALETVAPDGAR